jgi:hypothetical protein
MRLLYAFSCLLLLLAGAANIIQSVQYSVAKENGKLVEVTVKKKVIKDFGVKELQVSYDNKDYWVKVTQKKFFNSNPDKPVVLKYNLKNDLILDDDATKNNLVAGLLFISGAAFIFFSGVRRSTKI